MGRYFIRFPYRGIGVVQDDCKPTVLPLEISKIFLTFSKEERPVNRYHA